MKALSRDSFTFGRCGCCEGVHVRSLPALHDRFPQNLQVCVGLIIIGARVVPALLAVLSFGENRLCGGHCSCLILLVVFFGGKVRERSRCAVSRHDG